MREIKFRGKINKESDFIYGSLLVIGEETYIYQHDSGDLDDIDFGYAFEKVLPETVGQFTGLNDKNGKEIYDGDIVKLRGGKKPKEKERNFYTTIVVFKDSCFTVKENKSVWVDSYVLNVSIVIGNIHENPEFINER